MQKYEKVFQKTLLEEVDDINVQDLISDEGPTDPQVSDLMDTETKPGEASTEETMGVEIPGTDQDQVEKYEKAKKMVDKMEASISTELKGRIEELDDMVRRLGGLEENSLLSILKAGMDNNETLKKIYDREHRSIGKVSASISSLSQNLKSYIP